LPVASVFAFGSINGSCSGTFRGTRGSDQPLTGCPSKEPFRVNVPTNCDTAAHPDYPSWNYTPAEILADGIVHALGIGLGVLGAIILVVWAPTSLGTFALTAVLVYATALLAMFGISAAYNMWPVSPTKWLLRRFDHSAIYLMIAGTYTPLVSQLKASSETIGLLIGVWTVALIGAALKLLLPGRFDGLSVVLYLLLGWSVVVFYDSVLPALPSSALLLLALGGLLYSGGVAFHVWRSLRFQNAIWHAFVLVAAACHWGAIMHTVALAHS
jgi:hemolysin III